MSCLHFFIIVSCIVGKHKNTPHAQTENVETQQVAKWELTVYADLKGDNKSHIPNDVTVFFSYEKPSSGRWRCYARDPCGETPAL